jgi:hypothetical protein
MEANGTYTFTMLFEPAEEGGYANEEFLKLL